MTLPAFDPIPVAPPMSKMDAVARFCWPHRRLFPELVSAVELWLEDAGGWRGSLVEELRRPTLGDEWIHHLAEFTSPVGDRYMLTETGLRIANPGAFQNGLGPFLARYPDGQWLVLLSLWAGSCFDGGGEYRRAKNRRAFLKAILEPATASRLARRDESGRDARDLCRSAELTVRGLLPGVVDSTFGGVTPEAPGPVAMLRAVEALYAAGLLRRRRPRPVKLVTPEYWEQPAGFWNGVHWILRDGMLGGFSEDTRTFLRWLADRPSGRRRPAVGKPQVGNQPKTAQGLAELHAAWQAQLVMARLIADHPAAFWAIGSLVTINGIFVFGDGSKFAGNPTSLHTRSGLGEGHAEVRKTFRLPDACMWLAGDSPTEPSVFIEYEARRSQLLVQQHVLTALTLSSMWKKPIWMVVVATPDSRHETVLECDRLVDSAAIRAQEIEWPGADVRLRVVNFADATRGSALTCPAVWERRLFLGGRGGRRG